MIYSKSVNIRLYKEFFLFKEPELVPFKELARKHGVEPNKFRGMIRSAKHNISIFLQLVEEEGVDPERIPKWFARPRQLKAKRRRRLRRADPEPVEASAVAPPRQRAQEPPAPVVVHVNPVPRLEADYFDYGRLLKLYNVDYDSMLKKRIKMLESYEPEPLTPELMRAKIDIISKWNEIQFKARVEECRNVALFFTALNNLMKQEEARRNRELKRLINESYLAQRDFLQRTDEEAAKLAKEKAAKLREVVQFWVLKDSRADKLSQQVIVLAARKMLNEKEEAKQRWRDFVKFADFIEEERCLRKLKKAWRLHTLSPLLFPQPVERYPGDS